MELPDNENKWYAGVIKYFNDERGFGFVTCIEDQKEYFIHITNVLTSEIKAGKNVVFRLSPSRKKKKEQEACKLATINTFRDKPDILARQFLNSERNNFTDEIIDSVNESNVISFTDFFLTFCGRIDSEASYHKLKKFWTRLSAYEKESQTHASAAERVKKWLDEHTDSKYQVSIWLDGFIDYLPPVEYISDYISEVSDKEKLRIFNHINDPNVSLKILENLIKRLEYKKSLSLIQVYFTRLYKETQVENGLKFGKDKSWSNDGDREFYKNILSKVIDKVDDHGKLYMYLNNWIDECPIDYLMDESTEINEDDIAALLNREFFDRDKLVSLLIRIADKKLRSKESEQKAAINLSCIVYSEIPELPEELIRLLKLARKHQDKIVLEKIIDSLLESKPDWFHFRLWEEGFFTSVPIKTITTLVGGDTESYIAYYRWLEDKLITKDELILIVASVIKNLPVIDSPGVFNRMEKLITILDDIGYDETALPQLGSEINQRFYSLLMWLKGVDVPFDFNSFKMCFAYLKPEQQVLFVKKIFMLKHSNQIELTVSMLEELLHIDLETLDRITDERIIVVDLSVRLVLDAIISFSKKRRFLNDGDLLRLVYEYHALDTEYDFNVKGFFEECKGRKEAKYNWNTNGEIEKKAFGQNKHYFSITFSEELIESKFKLGSPTFETLKEKIKEIPGRKWSNELKHWGVPEKNESNVLTFARENRFYIKLPGNNFANNAHLAYFERGEVPFGIKFCDGRLSDKPDNTFKKEFWWCANKPCYEKCETIHEVTEWEKYTLLDLVLIMGFNPDEVISIDNRVTNLDKEYYKFISVLNRFYRLLEKLYCRDCGRLLHPGEESNFGYNRVNRFHCINDLCPGYQNEVYLNHCFNYKCLAVIDSRDSAKCPNGWYICPEENCSSCCSKEVIEKINKKLEMVGGHLYSGNDKEWHLERGMFFCHRCGRQKVLYKDQYEKEKHRCEHCNNEIPDGLN